MDKLRQDLERIFGEARIRIHDQLTQYYPTSQKTAEVLLVVNNKDELTQAVQLAVQHSISYTSLDLVTDTLSVPGELKGLVLKNDARKLEILARKGKMQHQQLITDFALIEAESGVPFSQLVRFAIEEGLGGLESGWGLKGSIGYVLQTEKDYTTRSIEQGIIQSLKVVTPTGEEKEITGEALTDDLLITSVVFKLQGEDKKILWLKAKKAAEKRGITEYQQL